MKPMVRTPLARIWIATASDINESFCGVLNTHLVLASVGRMIPVDAASEIIGTSASATTSRIARELGVIVDPTITSTLSLLSNFRVFLTASVVSDLSSRTMKLSFCPPIVGEPIISIVFFSGMPSDAAGPVAESVTPILMSAAAMPALSSAVKANTDFSALIVLLRKKSALDQRIANFAEKLDLLGRGRRRRRLRALQGVYLLHHQKNDERQDEKIDRHGQEIAVREKCHAGSGEGIVGHRPAVARRRRAKNDEPVAEVQSADNATDYRHDHILDQRIDQPSEGGADDDPDGKIDDAPLDRKLAKLLNERHRSPSTA